MKINKLLAHFERFIVFILLFFLGVIVLLTTYELIVILIRDIVSSVRKGETILLLDSAELLNLFSFVLLIIIGLELFEAVKQYFNSHVLQAEIILIVALTAIARKVIVLDYSKIEPFTLIGIASLVMTLAGSYYLIKRINKQTK
jgi:uncharacterized membrane protein (DUF373 family)